MSKMIAELPEPADRALPFRDRLGNIATFKLDKDKNIRNTSDALSELKDVNRLDESCLVATGHEATYREIRLAYFHPGYNYRVLARLFCGYEHRGAA